MDRRTDGHRNSDKERNKHRKQIQKRRSRESVFTYERSCHGAIKGKSYLAHTVFHEKLVWGRRTISICGNRNSCFMYILHHNSSHLFSTTVSHYNLTMSCLMATFFPLIYSSSITAMIKTWYRRCSWQMDTSKKNIQVTVLVCQLVHHFGPDYNKYWMDCH